MKELHLLIVEDKEEFFEILERMIFSTMTRKTKLPFHCSVRCARTLNQARGYLTADLDLIVFDACVDGDGNTPDSMEVVREFKEARPELPIIGMSGSPDCLPLLAEAGCENTFIKMQLSELVGCIIGQLVKVVEAFEAV